MSLATIEQHLIDRVKTRFGVRLKGVESLPADWDADTFERILRLAPGVFPVFGGGPAQNGASEILARWSFVVVTTHPGELSRRRGDSHMIGAYEIIGTLALLMHDHVVPDVGALRLENVENLFTGAIEKQGASIYAVEFSQLLPLDALTPDPSAPLDDFLQFHAETDLAAPDGRREAVDDVALPQ